MCKLIMIILSFCLGVSGFSQDPKTEEDLKLLAETSLPLGEYEVQKTSQLQINGEPFIKLEFDPKFKSGLSSSLLEKKNPTYLCQSDEYKLLGDPLFKTSYVALNVGSSILAYNQLKAAQWDKAKEVRDSYGYGNPEAKDAFATLLGGVGGFKKALRSILESSYLAGYPSFHQSHPDSFQ